MTVVFFFFFSVTWIKKCFFNHLIVITEGSIREEEMLWHISLVSKGWWRFSNSFCQMSEVVSTVPTADSHILHSDIFARLSEIFNLLHATLELCQVNRETVFTWKIRNKQKSVLKGYFFCFSFEMDWGCVINVIQLLLHSHIHERRLWWCNG